jgi:hypothetical protein
LVLSLSAEYEFKNLFISLIIPLIAINLIVNPILLDQYLKKFENDIVVKNKVRESTKSGLSPQFTYKTASLVGILPHYV